MYGVTSKRLQESKSTNHAAFMFTCPLTTTMGVWTLPAVKAICRSIVYFEFAFEALLPSTRRCNPWTKSNVYDNDHFPDKRLRTCFGLIDGCQTIPDIVELMNEGEDKYFG